MATIYLATGNAHKVDELSALFEREDLSVLVKSASALGGMPEVEETGKSFEGNARLKVRALADRVGFGNYALADDSGLEVDALGGAPGIYSSRFAGPNASDGENLEKLFERMAEIPDGQRGGQFTCSLVLMNERGTAVSFNGICRGHIIREARGENGFGYDPAFVPEGYDRTFGELGWAVKSTISHRAKALRQLIAWLKASR